MFEKIQQFRKEKYYFLFLSLLTGGLLSLSWYFPFTPLAFVALVPLLELENQIYEKDFKYPKLTFWAYSYLAISIWNVGVIWWLWNAAGPATLGAWLANALLQTFPLILFQITKKTSSNKFGLLPFIAFWIAFEYVHLHWDLSWVWLNLGNVFASIPEWVQWYEYTGSFGGSLWILIANVLAYRWFTNGQGKLNFALIIGFPLLISYVIYFSYTEQGEDIEVVAVQPNLDCYGEKFNYDARTGERNLPTYVPYMKQMDRLISLSEKAMTDKTSFILWPETAMHNGVEEGKALDFSDFKKVNEFIKQHPNARLITGIDSHIFYKDPSEYTETVREYQGRHYDKFGSAAFITGSDEYEFYHKSKLVIGVESMPFRSVLKSLIMNFGGTVGGLGYQENREVFEHNGEKAAPVICYESVYGDFMTDYVQEGATFIGVITNDGWWGDTSGHRQHFKYARLRAIELRRSIARSANTGTSGFINQRGDVLSKSNYDEMIAMKGTIKSNDKLTIYAQTGDILGRLACFLAPFLLLSGFVRKKVRS